MSASWACGGGQKQPLTRIRSFSAAIDDLSRLKSDKMR
ncbi:hypothetical protein PI124_g4290 [Phytophthora idaei]|nr:hypothetical protein PI126_g5071 [Phytophthora idaei]KAG3251106.1 hypothetical protein PI124_g4290 [Phytophthora idaei]